jgi:hypothetical protein
VLSDGTIAILRKDYHVDYIGADGKRTAGPKIPFDWQRLTDSAKTAVVDSVKALIERGGPGAGLQGLLGGGEGAAASAGWLRRRLWRGGGGGGGGFGGGRGNRGAVVAVAATVHLPRAATANRGAAAPEVVRAAPAGGGGHAGGCRAGAGGNRQAAGAVGFGRRSIWCRRTSCPTIARVRQRLVRRRR